jgi:alpha-tubulin suppressor-like RCC1 family protein
MPVIYPYTQYSGTWTLNSVINNVAAGNWATFGPKLFTWGNNLRGQLGLGNTTYYSSPKQVGALNTWSTVVSTHSFFNIALQTNGTLWTWGYNNYGQLGLGNRTYYSSPKQVGALTTWLKIAGGLYHTVAIKTDGTLWTWGNNVNGQLGLGNTTLRNSPNQVGALTNWSSIGGGSYHTVALKTDGTLWTWGNNYRGQLGLGNITYYSSPKQVGALTTWTIIMKNSRALYQTLAIAKL